MYAITRTHLQFIFTIIAKNHKRVHVDAEGSCYKNAERGMDSRMNQAQTGRRPNAGKEADSKKPKGGNDILSSVRLHANRGGGGIDRRFGGFRTIIHENAKKKWYGVCRYSTS